MPTPPHSSWGWKSFPKQAKIELAGRLEMPLTALPRKSVDHYQFAFDAT